MGDGGDNKLTKYQRILNKGRIRDTIVEGSRLPNKNISNTVKRQSHPADIGFYKSIFD